MTSDKALAVRPETGEGAAAAARSETGGVSQTLARASDLFARLGFWRERPFTREDLGVLFRARLTDGAANKMASQWMARYRDADEKTRRFMLAELVQLPPGKDGGNESYLRMFRLFNVQVEGLRFLVELRADMLRWASDIPGLEALDTALESLLSHWFDIGLLELKPITWDSPASLLEKLIQYEAVHEIRSWDDLRRRVGSGRRCYAFFHPRMADVPLIFVEVAFSTRMAGNVQMLLEQDAGEQDLKKARWAIFYSISNTQTGLRGISFGNFLLKRVIDSLMQELPQLRHFATLSPIPGFSRWLGQQDDAALQALVASRTPAPPQDQPLAAWWAQALRSAAQGGAEQDDSVQKAGLKLAAAYLKSLRKGYPIDPVARFHMGNGARIERLNWAADVSDKGMKQSFGLMVNYLYDLDELDENLERLAQGKPRAARGIA